MATTPQKLARHSDATVTEPLPGWLVQTDEALQELLRLPPNWNSYGARPVSPDNVRAAKDLLRAIVQPETPRPSVVPTVGGGVQLEWHTGGIDLEIEIQAPGQYHVWLEDPQENLALQTEIDSADTPRLAELCARLIPREQ
jgi:hypothetical protein